MSETQAPSSRVAGFHKRPLVERVAWVARLLSGESARFIKAGGGLALEVADRMSENVIGTHGLPLCIQDQI